MSNWKIARLFVLIIFLVVQIINIVSEANNNIEVIPFWIYLVFIGLFAFLLIADPGFKNN